MTSEHSADAVVGVISDTHGTLDPRVAAVFDGVERILHAGDVGSADVLLELETIAPVAAVLGNTDRAIPGFALGSTATIGIAGVNVLVTHELHMSRIGHLLPGVGVIVSGHTHIPSIDRHGGVLYLNPGAVFSSRLQSGQRTVAILELSRGLAVARIVEL